MDYSLSIEDLEKESIELGIFFGWEGNKINKNSLISNLVEYVCMRGDNKVII